MSARTPPAVKKAADHDQSDPTVTVPMQVLDELLQKVGDVITIAHAARSVFGEIGAQTLDNHEDAATCAEFALAKAGDTLNEIDRLIENIKLGRAVVVAGGEA